MGPSHLFRQRILRVKIDSEMEIGQGMVTLSCRDLPQPVAHLYLISSVGTSWEVSSSCLLWVLGHNCLRAQLLWLLSNLARHCDGSWCVSTATGLYGLGNTPPPHPAISGPDSVTAILAISPGFLPQDGPHTCSVMPVPLRSHRRYVLQACPWNMITWQPSGLTQCVHSRCPFPQALASLCHCHGTLASQLPSEWPPPIPAPRSLRAMSLHSLSPGLLLEQILCLRRGLPSGQTPPRQPHVAVSDQTGVLRVLPRAPPASAGSILQPLWGTVPPLPSQAQHVPNPGGHGGGWGRYRGGPELPCERLAVSSC